MQLKRGANGSFEVFEGGRIVVEDVTPAIYSAAMQLANLGGTATVVATSRGSRELMLAISRLTQNHQRASNMRFQLNMEPELLAEYDQFVTEMYSRAVELSKKYAKLVEKNRKRKRGGKRRVLDNAMEVSTKVRLQRMKEERKERKRAAKEAKREKNAETLESGDEVEVGADFSIASE